MVKNFLTRIKNFLSLGNILSEYNQTSLVTPVLPTKYDDMQFIARRNLPEFGEVWKKYIMPLKGQRVYLSNGTDYNIITDVTGRGITRISKNNSTSFVPIEIFYATYLGLTQSPNSIVTRDKILSYAKEVHHSLSSSIVVAVFAQGVPFISRIGKAKGLQLLLK